MPCENGQRLHSEYHAVPESTNAGLVARRGIEEVVKMCLSRAFGRVKGEHVDAME